MLSRVAETLYWTARYVERAENLARLINVNNLLMMDLPRGVSPGWAPLIDIIGHRESFTQHYSDYSEKNVLKYLTVDSRNPSSIVNALKLARDNTRTVREVVPRPVWETINNLYQTAKEKPNDFLSKRDSFASLTHVIEGIQLFFGALESTLNHDAGYVFIRSGSLLERADMTSRIIDVRSAVLGSLTNDSPYENLQWMSVLRSLSAYQMYRQQMGVKVTPQDVLEFMLHNPYFPRSVLFCLNQMRSLLITIPNSPTMLERIDHSITELNKVQSSDLQGAALHKYIDELQIDLADIHNQFAEQYFLV